MAEPRCLTLRSGRKCSGSARSFSCSPSSSGPAALRRSAEAKPLSARPDWTCFPLLARLAGLITKLRHGVARRGSPGTRKLRRTGCGTRDVKDLFTRTWRFLTSVAPHSGTGVARRGAARHCSGSRTDIVVRIDGQDHAHCGHHGQCHAILAVGTRLALGEGDEGPELRCGQDFEEVEGGSRRPGVPEVTAWGVEVWRLERELRPK